jgi:cellulose synthase/poly-beta-1,6-N-acetylglucosamine synthase-like glycosyltransferase
MTSVDARPRASVLMVVCGEPLDRVRRAVDAVARQEGAGTIELVIAAPHAEHRDLASVHAHGAVGDLRLVDSPGGSRSGGLNAALGAARGSVVARVDARSVPPPDYVARCVARLERDPDVGVVGAIQRPHAGGDGVIARGIARALRNPYFLGSATYRRRDGAGPADTAYLGAFRRDQLARLGGFDEGLAANEDFELCSRYRGRGAVVWVEQGLEVPYEARTTFAGLWRQYQHFGDAKVAYWRRSGSMPNRRQAAVLLAGGAALAVAAVAVRRPAVAAVAAAGAAVTLAVVDHVVEPDERDARVRVAAAGAAVTLGAAWCCGVLRGAARWLRAPDR